MWSPVELLEYATKLFLVALCLVFAFQLLTGQINTRGLLFDKVTGAFSPVRLQLLVFTLIALVDFVFWESSGDGLKVNEELLYLLGGSQILYLTGKSNSVFHLFQSSRRFR